jgi:hypothetical protein
MTRWSELQLSDALLLVCEMTASRLRLRVLQRMGQEMRVLFFTELALEPPPLSDSSELEPTSSPRKTAPRLKRQAGASLAKRQGAAGRSRAARV